MNKTYFPSQERMQRCEYIACYEHNQRFVSTGLHSHDAYELYIHFKGAEVFHVEDCIYHLSPDQLIIIPPYQMHGIPRGKTLSEYDRGSLYISSELLHSLARNMLNIDDRLFHTIVQNPIQYQLSNEQAAKCKESIYEMLENPDPSVGGKCANYACMINAVRIIWEAIMLSDKCPKPIASNSLLYAVLSYINDHFTEALTLEELARTFKVSQSFLSHEFPRYTGKSVYDYILSKRIDLSKEMMPARSLSMYEIAERCGFHDYSNFLRSFKKQTKITPSAYRKNLSV